MKALRYAARRAAQAGCGIGLLYVVEPDEFQHWRVVAEAMKAEAREAAEVRLSALCDEVQAQAGRRPHFAIREGKKSDAVLDYISEPENSVAVLVLGAGSDGEGPGPLVASLAGQLSGTFKVPIVIVPGGMSLEEIDAVT